MMGSNKDVLVVQNDEFNQANKIEVSNEEGGRYLLDRRREASF